MNREVPGAEKYEVEKNEITPAQRIAGAHARSQRISGAARSRAANRVSFCAAGHERAEGYSTW